MSTIPLYLNTPRLLEVCNSFVGQTLRPVVHFMGRDIPVNDPNIVGNMFETVAWNSGLKEIGDVEEGPLQEPPDFYVQNREFQLEMKVYRKSPAFDLSNFNSYVNQLCEDGGVMKKLFKTKYLVFEYSSEGEISMIKKFSYLDVWKLVEYDNTNPLTVQVKGGTWYNLRPGAASGWNDAKKTPARFIKGICACIEKCPQILDKEAKIKNIQHQFELISSQYTL
jgi:hypothetical protein